MHGSRGLAAHPARPESAAIAEPLYQEERKAETARQRLTDVRRLPLRQMAAGDAVKLSLDDGHYTIRDTAYVIRLDGTTCLQLTNDGGIRQTKGTISSWWLAGIRPVLMQDCRSPSR